MNPLFFGDSHSPLFGILSEPAVDKERGHGVLICPPIAQEHVRSHWALRQVAGALARAGFHVLRFDWFGVGDSSGELAEASLARWCEDAVTAAQELKDATGARRLSVLGLRLGATLALLAQKRLRARDLVLWDPVLSGRAYASELASMHARAIVDPMRFHQPVAGRRPSGTELLGFELGAPLLAEIQGIEPEALADVGKARVAVLESHPRQAEAARWDGAMSAAAREVERRPLELVAQWGELREIETQLLPADALRAIVDVLEAA